MNWKRIIALILVIVLCGSAVGAGALMLFRPSGFKGEAGSYSTITMELEEGLYYDVHVPPEAVLLSTDHASIYEYDLLTVGVQDTEPTSDCKLLVGNHWVFANSEEGWIKATLAGFETEQPYKGAYTLPKTIKWDMDLPERGPDVKDDVLEELRKGGSQLFGGPNFITVQEAYGTFDVCVDRAMRKMQTLYGETISNGIYTSTLFWIPCGDYTIGITPINYNTNLVVCACGEVGREYAAELMR